MHRRTFKRAGAAVAVLLLSEVSAFSIGRPSRAFVPSSTSTALHAAPKKKIKVASAALDALEKLALLDEPLSLKELQAQEKKKKQEAKQQQTATSPSSSTSVDAAASSEKPLSKMEKMLLLEQQAEQYEADLAAAVDVDEPKLSKKELKDLKKKEEKEQRQLERKAAKKAEGLEKAANSGDVESQALNGHAVRGDTSMGDDDADVDDSEDENEEDDDVDLEYDDDDMDGEGEHAYSNPHFTLEDKIRRERPPPRIRVMESSQPGYTSLRLENVGIMFRNQAVLRDVTWGVQTGDRIGLVGANGTFRCLVVASRPTTPTVVEVYSHPDDSGAGKTTQLRILANELEPTTGDVVKSSSDLRVSMLRQEFVDELVPERTLREEFLSVFEEENTILQELQDCESELANSPPEDVNRMQEILDRMQELQNEAENKEVYALESRIKKIMDVMGFNDDEGEDLVASFSGGWKMRIGLGKVLLKDPNVLLLDEVSGAERVECLSFLSRCSHFVQPTNHLDLESVEWLEAFLREQNIPMIIVSHDREFLDQVCTKIVDAEGGICTEYDGNYSRFLELKQARMDAWNAAYNAQEKKIKEERQWISKFKVKQPQAVKQRIAKLEKFMASEEYVRKPPFVGKPFRFRFPDAPRLSPEVAEIKDLSHSYRNEQTQNRLFEDVNAIVEKGDRIAVVGPNGKSTVSYVVPRGCPEDCC
jgi:ATPase subunit of ABC transporter with duplicated ATPase domains